MADPEVNRAKAQVRQREREVWSDVEKAGAARMAERQAEREAQGSTSAAVAELRDRAGKKLSQQP